MCDRQEARSPLWWWSCKFLLSASLFSWWSTVLRSWSKWKSVWRKEKVSMTFYLRMLSDIFSINQDEYTLRKKSVISTEYQLIAVVMAKNIRRAIIKKIILKKQLKSSKLLCLDSVKLYLTNFSNKKKALKIYLMPPPFWWRAPWEKSMSQKPMPD